MIFFLPLLYTWIWSLWITQVNVILLSTRFDYLFFLKNLTKQYIVPPLHVDDWLCLPISPIPAPVPAAPARRAPCTVHHRSACPSLSENQRKLHGFHFSLTWKLKGKLHKTFSRKNEDEKLSLSFSYSDTLFCTHLGESTGQRLQLTSLHSLLGSLASLTPVPTYWSSAGESWQRWGIGLQKKKNTV